MSKEESVGSVVPEPDSSSSPNGHSPLPDCHSSIDDSLYSRQGVRREQDHRLGHASSHSVPSYSPYQLPHGLPAGYSQPTPFPSQAEGSWLHPSFASGWSRAGYPNSFPSCLSPKDSYSGESCYSRNKFLSLPGRYSPSMSSLEPPHSLHSNPPSADMHHHTLSPYYCSPQGVACCAQCPVDAFNMVPMAHPNLRPGYQPAHGPYCECQVLFCYPKAKEGSCTLVASMQK